MIYIIFCIYTIELDSTGVKMPLIQINLYLCEIFFAPMMLQI